MTKKVDVENLSYLVEDRKLQLRIVGQLIGMGEETVRNYCKKFGIKRQRTGPRGGELHPDWRGGVKISKGYRYIYAPNHPFCTSQRYVLEHRLVMEKKLGRYLHPKEVCHHIDKNPTNNSPENLIVFGSNGKHLAHELAGKTPDWSPEGYANMCRANPNWSSIRQKSKDDDDQPSRPSR